MLVIELDDVFVPTERHNMIIFFPKLQQNHHDKQLTGIKLIFCCNYKLLQYLGVHTSVTLNVSSAHFLYTKLSCLKCVNKQHL